MYFCFYLLILKKLHLSIDKNLNLNLKRYNLFSTVSYKLTYFFSINYISTKLEYARLLQCPLYFWRNTAKSEQIGVRQTDIFAYRTLVYS
jgi:hypothetical protein